MVTFLRMSSLIVTIEYLCSICMSRFAYFRFVNCVENVLIGYYMPVRERRMFFWLIINSGNGGIVIVVELRSVLNVLILSWSCTFYSVTSFWKVRKNCGGVRCLSWSFWYWKHIRWSGCINGWYMRWNAEDGVFGWLSLRNQQGCGKAAGQLVSYTHLEALAAV